MIKPLSTKIISKLLFVVGLVVLVVSGVIYWREIYIDPAKVFDRMLMSSLSTPTVTKTTSQADDSQKLRQTTVLLTQPKPLVRSVSVLTQAGDESTKVTTESIATPTTDFVRYSAIETGQKNAEGKPFDFKNVVGVWGKSEGASLDDPGIQLFNQTLLGVVPFADLPKSQRAALLQQIKKEQVYKIDTSKVIRGSASGRPMYTYEVTVSPVAYVRMLKVFAQSQHITQLDEVKPELYAQSTPRKFTFEIDVLSGQLKKIVFGQGGHTEVYSAYGARVTVTPPDSAIPVEELQNRLQNIR